MSRLNPVPHTPLRDNPTEDAIWKRYLEQIWIKTAAWVSGPSSSTDNAVPRFNGTDGIVLQNSGVIIDDSNNVTGVVNLTTTGNTILGDAAADTYTINAGVWTYGSNYSATRNAGTVSAGAVSVLQEGVDFIGDSGGTSNVRPWVFTATPAGSNNLTETRVLTFNANNNSTGTTTLTQACSGTINILNSGPTTSGICFSAAFIVTSSGTITIGQGFFVAAPAFLSSGGITTIVGHDCANLGNANVGTAIAFRAIDMSGASVGMQGFRSQLASGSGKLNFYASGNADNIFAGNTRIGGGTVPTVALDVTGSAIVSGALTVGGALTSSANVRVAHGTSALATNATEGFLHLQSCAGAPTGVPATIPTGQIPMVIDSTNLRIYAYIGGAWKSVAVA